MHPPLRFYFDVISPYAYLGFHLIYPLAERHHRDVELVPILFARLLDANGTKGPAEIPSKRAYVFKDAYRTARVANIPFGPPPAHPFNPLLALRIAALPELAGDRRRVVELLFRAVWGGDGSGVTDAAVVQQLLADRGFPAGEWIRAATEPANKARVRDQTEAALARGVFGVPTVDVDGELFWGIDSFAHIERRLLGDDPINDDLLARWVGLPAHAVRRGFGSSQ